ncbi:MAG: three-Cys-motif partner protein TcmP [candidate division Zixibacteria bacterium]|nr:three-Cys-motif partner protein TcmP [candidate division Zixibacteria bacterium]
MTKDFHSKPFDESTKLKLDIFRECFKEWLPVFIHNPYIEHVFIFDFFAGSGKDKTGFYGSPLILLEEARGENRKYCTKVRKKVTFNFYDRSAQKIEELRRNVKDFFWECKEKNCCKECVYEIEIQRCEFKKLLEKEEIQGILSNTKFGKFVLLDQCGFKEISPNVFRILTESPKTDFIFFISSDFVRRFKEHPSVKRYIDTSGINVDEGKPIEYHRAIANYYRNLMVGKENYYLHHFSIKKPKEKGGNIYGLIFGSNHTLGMEKFLKVCWKHDKYSGESNFNIDSDYEEGNLFYNPNRTNKQIKMRQKLEQMILSRDITDNIAGFKYALKNGCLPILFTEVVLNLEKEGKIRREGDVKNASTNIHKVKEYKINVISNEHN